MERILKIVYLTGLFIGIFHISNAQELKAKVTVNSSKIQTTDRTIFETLERNVSELINGTQWSSSKFSTNEKIDCTFTIIVNSLEGNTFSTELSVQARRPVYNSSYVTTILNYRDVNLDFDYQENQIVEYVATNIDNNLVATIVFYCNLILALDFDSFSPLGGNSFFRVAQSIASQAQSSSWKGWTTFGDNKSRSVIISAFLDESLKPLREYWYTYHRKGLDEMSANADRARITIVTGLPILKEARGVRNSEAVIQMFADSKLAEIVLIAGKCTSEEKKELYDLLRDTYPTASTQLEPLKK